MSGKSLAVVIMAAGQGTRMKSRIPKVLHPLAGIPLIAHVLRTAQALKASPILVVVRHERDAVSSVVLEHEADAVIVDQDDIPGTARAVQLAVEALPADFDGKVLVLSGDVPLLDTETLTQLCDTHDSEASLVTLLTTKLQNPGGYGRIVRNGEHAVERIVEEKDASVEEKTISEINTGIYCFDRDTIATYVKKIESQNTQNERYLTDIVSIVRSHGGKVSAVRTPDAWRVEGVNDRVQLASLARKFNDTLVEKWQRAGVSILDPRTTWIDVDATLEEDVTLLPGTQILGCSHVCSFATIGPETTLSTTTVGVGATVRKSDVFDSVIAADAKVGPFSFLRAGTDLGQNGKIGAFVETKNARIGSGSKVPHLSYVGDAHIGESSNIGAGAIFANYDGREKHRTTIGSGVRSGSHTVFVAPVTVEDDSYTAAGTIVRKNVPTGSLAMTVATQRNIEGWVAKNRHNAPANKPSDNEPESEKSVRN